MKQESRHVIIVTLFCAGIYFLSLAGQQGTNNNRQTDLEGLSVSNLTKPNTNLVIKLEHCQCSRTIQRNSRNLETNFSQTTCGRDAYQRGSNQKVVSFSFYGNPESKQHRKRKYFEGINENLQEMLDLYGEDWIMRLYIDFETSDSMLGKLCHLACRNNNIDLCFARDLPGTPVRDAADLFPMLWRFFPSLDPQVDILLSRDLDSLIGQREVSAVTEWLQSGKLLHSMRDHPQHSIPILGGTWGARLTSSKARQKWQKSWKMILKHKMAHSPRNATGPDQKLLQHGVWPLFQQDSLQHDSYSCKTFADSVGFPTKRTGEKKGNFIGGGHLFWEECPVRCRRKGHQDWKYC